MDTAILVVATLTLLAAVAVVPFAVLSWRYARRAEGRETERSDVSWNLADDVSVGTVTLENTGRDTAYDVLAVMTVLDEVVKAEALEVAPGARLMLESKALREASDEAIRESAEQARERRRNAFYVPSVQMPTLIGVEVRMTWRSPQRAWSDWSYDCRLSL